MNPPCHAKVNLDFLEANPALGMDPCTFSLTLDCMSIWACGCLP